MSSDLEPPNHKYIKIIITDISLDADASWYRVESLRKSRPKKVKNYNCEKSKTTKLKKLFVDTLVDEKFEQYKNMSKTKRKTAGLE